MRIAVATIQHEGNSFSPCRTDLSDFRAGYLHVGQDVIAHLAARPFEVGGACNVAEAEDMELIPILACWAMPAGPVNASAWDFLRGTLLRGIEASGRVDGVLLVLHGAMVVDGLDDPEGRLLADVRGLVGASRPLVASLDLHANVTAQMVGMADALVGYQTVPHVDHFDTGLRAARLLARQVRGEIRPMMAYHKLPMITPAEKHDTNRGPMRRLMEQVRRVEREPGVLAAGLYPVQPWLDVPELGWSVVVVADGDQPLAQRHADDLARLAWISRDEFLVEKTPIPEAIRRAVATPGWPVVMSDTGDVSSGGAPGDSAALLAALLAAGSPGPALLDIVDPPAVERAIVAGVGAILTLPLGGSIDTDRQRPVTVTGRVAALSNGRFVIEGPSLRGYRANLGRTAVLEVGNIAIVVHERGEMNIDPALYESVGLDPRAAKIVQVKSPCGFRAAYEPLAAEIILLDSPGCTTTHFSALPFQRAPRPLFPLDPFP